MTTPCHHLSCNKPADIKVGDNVLLCAHHYLQASA